MQRGRGYQKGILSIAVRRVVIKSAFSSVVLQRPGRLEACSKHNEYVYLLV